MLTRIGLMDGTISTTKHYQFTNQGFKMYWIEYVIATCISRRTYQEQYVMQTWCSYR